MQLNEVQARMRDVILDHPDVVANPPADLAAVFETRDIALGDRLKVYRNNIVGSLSDIMVASFPVLEKVVGKPFLEGMSRSFILKNPPAQGCLNYYGRGFAEFIEGFEPAKSLAYLPDIARLEIAMNDAYYALDDAALDAQDLARIDPEKLGDLNLRLRDYVHLLSSPFALLDIRDFALAGGDGEAPVLEREIFIMVHRPKFDAQMVVLDAAAFNMLTKFKQGATLGEAVEEVLSQYPDFDFQGFLGKHITLETFRALDANG